MGHILDGEHRKYIEYSITVILKSNEQREGISAHHMHSAKMMVIRSIPLCKTVL